jgi:hypothetical protein
MTFQIIRYVTQYCPIHGGMSGSRAERLPMTYHSEALARRLAGRMHNEDYNLGGDDSFGVVPYGASAYPQNYGSFGPTVATDDMPF